jgi:hypothetical protein
MTPSKFLHSRLIACGGILLILLPGATLGQVPLFTVTSPQEGQVFGPGATISVMVSPAPGVVLRSLVVTSPIGSAQAPASTGLTLVAPQDRLGPVQLLILVDTVTGSAGSAMRTIQIETAMQLQQINISPGVLHLIAPQTSRILAAPEQMVLNVDGVYTGGIVRDIRASSQTVFSSDNPQVAVVDSTGQVTAVAPGKTTIRVHSSGATGSAAVEVNIFELDGDLDGDGDVDQDDRDIVHSALGRPASGAGDPRDFNNDGQLNDDDLLILESLCSRPSCAREL